MKFYNNNYDASYYCAETTRIFIAKLRLIMWESKERGQFVQWKELVVDTVKIA